MIGTIEQMLQDMKNGVYDFTKDGKCSSCGSCCGRYLPISEKELKEIKRYVKKYHIKPQKHFAPTIEPTLDLTCPLRNDTERKCMCYEVRPQICRSFLCSNPKNGIWATKQEFHAKYRVVDMRKEIWEDMMNAVKEDVEKLVQKELESANQKFPMFRSDHEGAAVIFEEIEESKSNQINIELIFSHLWKGIKKDMTDINLMNGLKREAINLACEAIQVAAMAQKFIDSQKEREKSEGN